MKKILSIILVIFFMFLLPTMVQAETLRLGSRGAGVVQLQTKLNNVGFNVGKVDGIFGSMTQKSVIRFQASRSLAMDGIVGTLTAQLLTADSVVATAKKYIGVRYLWGGNTPSGFDCSGLTSYVFTRNGIMLPRVSRDQFNIGTSVRFENLQVGDLVFFSFTGDGMVSHVGIYIGGGQFINASSSRGVVISPFTNYWKSAYVGSRRVF